MHRRRFDRESWFASMIRLRVGHRLSRFILALVILSTGELAVDARTLHAGGSQGEQPQVPDHDDALAARARGEIKSLDEILQLLKPRKSDRMVDVVLSRRDGRFIYEVTLLTKLGRYRIFTVDATDGAILKDETK